MALERHAVVAGRPMRWLEAGDASGRALVWLHAFPLRADMWRPQLEAAPAGWRVIAPDLAGFGGTADHDGPPGIDDFARDTYALADHLGLARFTLGGLSMGGYALFACLRRDASRVEGILLADTKSGADAPQAREGRQKMLDLVSAKGVAGVADEMLPKLLGATTQRENPGLAGGVRRLIESNAAAGVARAIARLRDRPDSTPQLAGIAVPALVLVGEEDGITPVPDARAMAAAIPGATLAILPRAGHLANLEAPDVFNAAVAPWLAGL
jgi:pimeloyl-ACP methyl ester carboxylesterase